MLEDAVSSNPVRSARLDRPAVGCAGTVCFVALAIDAALSVVKAYRYFPLFVATMARMARLDVRLRAKILFRIDDGYSLVFEKASNGVQMRALSVWLRLLLIVFLDDSISRRLGELRQRITLVYWRILVALPCVKITRWLPVKKISALGQESTIASYGSLAKLDPGQGAAAALIVVA